MNNFTNVSPIYEWVTHVLPLVYDDTLTYMEMIGKLTKKLNEIIENNNNLPDYITNLIQKYISSGEINKVLSEILANYMLNVKYPPSGLTPATGDGSADDTKAIQGCIDYASEHNGMCVYFPSGDYLTSSLVLKNKTSMFGQDRYTTRLVLKGGATKPMFTGNVDQLSISGLGLDGNGDVQVNNVNLIDLTIGSAIIQNCFLTDGYNLVNAVVGTDLQLCNCVFNHAIFNAVNLTGNGKAMLDNVIFNSVSKTVGNSYITNALSNSCFDNLSFVGSCPVGIINTGSMNNFSYQNIDCVKAYQDSGAYNTFADLSRDVNTKLNGNYELNVKGTISESCDDSKSENVGKNKTSVIGGNYSEGVKGTKNETVTGQKIGQYKNLVENADDINLNATKDISLVCDVLVEQATNIETMAQTRTDNYNSATTTVTGTTTLKTNTLNETTNGLKTESSTNKNENVVESSTETFGNKTLKGKTYTENATTNSEIGDTKTSSYSNSTETVQGTKTESFNYYLETVKNNKTVTVTGDMSCSGKNVSLTSTENFSLNGKKMNFNVNDDTLPLTGKSKTIDLLNPEIFTLPDVKHFGAKGDGKTDDTIAIQKSLDEQGVAIFPSGVYMCSHVRMPSNSVLYGLAHATLKCSGQDAIVLNKSDGKTGGYNANTNLTIFNLDFDGNKENYYCSCIGFGHANKIRIINCTFHSLKIWHFIEINSCEDTLISCCEFYDYGVSGEGFTEMIQLDFATDSTVFPWFGPYDSTINHNIVIDSCIFNGNAELRNGNPNDIFSPAGVGNHNRASGKVSGVTITNCSFINLGSSVKTYTLHNAIFANNRTESCTCGFRASGYFTDSIIANNIFYGVSDYNNIVEYNRGIYLLYDYLTENIHILNNSVRNFGGHGITAQGNLITINGNTVNSCGEHGIYLCYDNFGVMCDGNTVFSNGLNTTQTFYDIFANYTRNHTPSNYYIGDVTISNNKCGKLTTQANYGSDTMTQPVIVDQNYIKTTFNKSSDTKIFKFGTNWLNFVKS